jgi:hypothetical protein
MKRKVFSLSAIAVLIILTFGFCFASTKSSHYKTGPTYSFIPEPENEAYLISFSNGIIIDTRVGEPEIPEILRIDEPWEESIYYIIQFNGPIRQQWFRELKRLGIKTIGYLPNYAVLGKMNRLEKSAVSSLPMVHWVGIFQPAYKLQEILIDASGIKDIVILITPGEDVSSITEQINLMGGSVEEVMETDFGRTIRTKIDANLVPNLARLQEVLWIQEWSEAEICNVNDQWVVQTGWRSVAPPANDTSTRRVWTKGARGQGLILSTTDSGLRHTHNMFRDTSLSVTPPGVWPSHRKVVAFKLYSGASTNESPFHGTHVNGTVAGDDSLTGGTSNYDGMSINARLYFVDVSSSSGSFIIPSDLTAMYDTVYLGRGLGYKILQHSGSWGWSNSSGTYLIQDASTDAYCWRNKDFLNIYAAGNEGGRRRIRNPGISKNVITVGGTQNGTSSNLIYTNSSRGWTQDGRIKPTICAPAVALWSASNSGDASYTQLTGTSMATPGVNGAVGLIRCYLQRGYYPTGESVPANQINYISSALLKAMAITSADPNVGSYVVPDSNIGWGRIDVDSVLYFNGDLRKLLIRDDTIGVTTGQFKEDTFTINSSIPLKICVAWTDTAALPSANPTLVNNLNLEVFAPTGTYYRGNQYSAGQSISNPSTWDIRNVEECVRVNSPITGLWRIRVYGQNVVTTRQPFAYCITGDIALASPPNLDVGVTAIVAPPSVIDSGTTITPQAWVRNYGTSTATFPVTFRIGGFYNNTQIVTNLASGDSTTVSFTGWTAIQRGTWSTKCTTALTGDQNSSNDMMSGSVTVRVQDVGVTQIIAPSGTVDSGAVITPQARVKNFGIATVSFPVTLRIGTLYTNTQNVNNLNPGDSALINFASWIALPRGMNTTQCSTAFIGDANPVNNSQIGSVTVQVRDVGVVQIMTPSGTIDSIGPIIPQARVRNYGTNTETFDVTFRIGTSYIQTRTKTLNAGIQDTVNFMVWTPIRGTYPTRCSTYLASDAIQINDTLSASVTVQVKDIGITQIITPSGTIDSTGQIIPQAQVMNYGTNTETFDVTFNIGTSYTQTRFKTLDAGIEDTVNFSPWTTIRGTYSTRCSTYLIGDVISSNDTISGSVTVQVKDVGVAQILAPTGNIISGIMITPRVRIANFGTTGENFPVYIRIISSTDTIYYDDTMVTIEAGHDSILEFNSWLAVSGSYNTFVRTALIGDQLLISDTLTNSFLVTEAGWQTMANVPSAPSGKNPKSGSCMAGLEATGLIYFLKASNRPDFYSYTPDLSGPGTWLALETIPKGEKGMDYSDGKYPKRGAAMAAYEPGKCIYVVRGNNRLGFWEYQCDTLGDTMPGWNKLATIPAGAKRCKYGTGLVYVTKEGKDYLFLMKGAKTNEFYLYDIETNTWAAVTSPPTGASGKIGYKKGSCLAFDGTEYIYVLQGYYGSFFKYNVEADSWAELKWYNYKTYLNRDGKKKKPKDGAALVYHNNNIYMLKGGNTNEVWKYDIAIDDWLQMGPIDIWDIPFGPTNKKVKDGGTMIKFGDYFYASKGKNTPEFYRHVAPTITVAVPNPEPINENTMSRKSIIDASELTVVPNPAINAISVKYSLPKAGPVSLKLYNIAGVLVKSFTNSTLTKNGALIIDVKTLANGVYILRFDSENMKVTRKLVIEK